ncbi:hypothetical protein BC351_40235 [Paenibacillus ferrarius]|uniref:NADH:flavin oxidoreductase/NADH oxidase N-terminal domain-containing protein n=1 Tax=Paenibacillus ferrarius TaxID=1469647 RepID=A0A1V4H9B5_9BACL|nr:hypothetical protein BC351_40235 [Paenibacillus ferrarius]
MGQIFDRTTDDYRGISGLNEEFMRSFTSGHVVQVTGLDGLIERIERNEFDLVAVGRSLLADPEWTHGGGIESLSITHHQ